MNRRRFEIGAGILALSLAILVPTAAMMTGDSQETSLRNAVLAEADAEWQHTESNPPAQLETWHNPDSLIKSRDWDAHDSEILMKIAMAEAEGEGVEGKALVMCVVLNRVWSEGFPDSIEDVVFKPGQFSVMQAGGRYYTTTPDEECHEALSMVARGWDESQGATFFEAYYNTNSWHRNNLKRLFQYGGHIFYTVPDKGV